MGVRLRNAPEARRRRRAIGADICVVDFELGFCGIAKKNLKARYARARSRYAEPPTAVPSAQRFIWACSVPTSPHSTWSAVRLLYRRSAHPPP